MNEFWQTLLIATIPSGFTALISYFVSVRTTRIQIKAIREQNKADIEKLIEQNRADIEALKEKYRLEMEAKEKEYQHQLEVIKIQHNNEMEKDKDAAINQLTENAISGLLGGLFEKGSPMSNKFNEELEKLFVEQMTKK